MTERDRIAQKDLTLSGAGSFVINRIRCMNITNVPTVCGKGVSTAIGE